MKTAIILSGNIRSFFMKYKNYTLCELFLKNIAISNQADIFIYTDTNDYYYNDNIYFTTDPQYANKDGIQSKYSIKYIDNNTSRDILQNELLTINNLKYLYIEDIFDITKDPKYDLLSTAGKTMGGTNPPLLLHQMRKFKKCYDALIDYENINNFKYDYIIRWRFDNLAEDILDLKTYDFNNYDIYVSGIFVPLVYDWCTVGKREEMHYCLNLYNALGSYISEGNIYMCGSGSCNKYGNNQNFCSIHNKYSDISLSAEYHLFRTFKDNNVRVKVHTANYGGRPFRYENH